MAAWNETHDGTDESDELEVGFEEQQEPSGAVIEEATPQNKEAHADEASESLTGEEPGQKRAKRARSGTLTRAQVQRVLDTTSAIAAADPGERALLAHVLGATEDVDALVLAILTKPVSGVDALAELCSLLETSELNQLLLAARITGMARQERGQVHLLLAQVTGDRSPLPRDEVGAAIRVAEMVLGLTDSERQLITRVQGLRA